MSLILTGSEQFNKSENKLNFVEVSWKNLMNECLISTKILKSSKIDYEECLRFDPNFLMNMRHKMFQQFSKTFLISETQIYSEALKILRSENHCRLLQKKESKIIEKEIDKLKQILEKRRLLAENEINETNHKRIKSSSNAQKFAKYCPKLPKKLENYDAVNKINSLLKQVHMTDKSKTNQQKIPVSVKGSLKKNEQEDEILEPIFTQNNSIIEINIENGKHILEVKGENNEIMKSVFEKCTEQLKQESLNDVKKDFKIRKELEVQHKINKKILEDAWRTWKAYAQRLKNRRREKTIYTCKIESFLSYLREKQTRQKSRYVKREMKTSLKHEIKTNLTTENRVNIKRKETIKNEKEEKLKKLMQEVKISQADTKKKLQEITKTNSKNRGKLLNPKFLQNIEKRRQERLKRRKEIQERKLKLEEEEKKAEIKKEEEKKQREKQIRLQELKKRRILEKEKKLEQKRKREKIRLNMKLAENHYETYLLRCYGWRPWTMLLNVRDLQYQHAEAFYEKRIMQRIFRRWKIQVKEHVEQITARAVNFYKSTLKKKLLLIWKKFLERKRIQDQVAVDWNEFKITERVFKRWLQFTQYEILEYLNKKEIVGLFYERKLKAKSFKKIRAYPEFRKLEQAKHIRKRMWQQKIKEILPDFQPVDISE